MQKFTKILDIGSEKVTAVIGARGVNNSLDIKTFLSAKYEGFYQGEFLNIESLKQAVADVTKKIEQTTKVGFEKCFIGVPAEFCHVETATSTLSFVKESKINAQIVDELCSLALSSVKQLEGYTLINRAPIVFSGAEGQKSTDPEKIKTTTVFAELCFVFAKNSFLEEISKILKDLGILKFDFISSSLAQVLFLLPESERKNQNIIIDVGYITSSVFLSRGEGILNLASFSIGGGHISAKLSQELKIKYSEAEELKKQATLSVQKQYGETYVVERHQKTLPLDANLVDEIIKKQIDSIAREIKKAILSFNTQIEQNKEVYLTGSGILNLKGAKDYLSKCLGREVCKLATPAFNYRNPANSSALSLLNFAILLGEIEKRR